MKITKARLKEIIQEELLREQEELGPHIPQVDPLEFSEQVSEAVDALGEDEVMRIVTGVIQTLSV